MRKSLAFSIKKKKLDPSLKVIFILKTPNCSNTNRFLYENEIDNNLKRHIPKTLKKKEQVGRGCQVG